MTKWIMVILVLVSAISMISALDAQAQLMHDSIAGNNISNTLNGAENIIPNNKIVEILGLDQTSFPKVKANVSLAQNI